MSALTFLGVLIPLQLVAAFLALRLIRVTGERLWSFITIGMTLMALGHSIAFFGLSSAGAAAPPSALGAAGVELAASLCMVIGMAWLGAPLHRLKRSEEHLHESEKAHAAQIEAHHQVERSLQEQEEQFRNLVEGSIEGIIIHRDFKPLFVNRAWAVMHGYAPEDILAMDSALDFIAPDDRERILSYKEARLRGEAAPHQHEYQAMRRDGSKLWVSTHVRLVQWQGGPAIQVTSHDVTERKQAEQALRKREELHRTLIEQAAEGILIADAQKKYIDVNPSACEMTGYAREELLGKRVGEMVSRESLETLPIRLDTLDRGEALVGQRQLIRKDGSAFPIEFSAKVLSDGHLLIMLRDNTERQRLEAQLRQSQKMEAIGTLAGGIAHEFNNILSSIIGFSDLAQRQLSPETAVWDYVKQVGIAGLRAKDLVQQILAFSRQSDIEREPVQIHQIVRESLQLLRPALPATIEIQQELAAVGSVLGNATQIHQIVMNLCSNAEHAMRMRGGRLALRLDTAEIDEAMAPFFGDLQPGSYVRLAVQDNGHGIPPEAQERIFEPFFTTKEVGQGTGLGLATVHGIVSDYGGAITVDSAVDEGATFMVYLPRIADAAPIRDAGVEDEPPGRGERILAVDDDPMLTRMLHAQLQSLGYHVQSTSSSQEALAIFQAAPETFDLVITDQTMPEMTGEQLTQSLRQIRPDIPIILCTGFSHIINAESARAIGVDAFCIKPLMRQNLSRTIQQAVAHRAAIAAAAGVCILLIDDDEQFRLMLRYMLESAGYTVVETANGRDGVCRYRQTPTDVVITDLIMPEQEGAETIEILRRDKPEAKIIAISGGPRGGKMDCLEMAKHLGAQRILRKPFEREELLQALRELLQPER